MIPRWDKMLCNSSAAGGLSECGENGGNLCIIVSQLYDPTVVFIRVYLLFVD